MLASRLSIDSQTSFRTNPHLDLVLTERLNAADQELFNPLHSDLEFYGIARDRRSSVQRAVDCNTALLLHALREPGPLPSFARQHQTGLVTRMVLDGLLEIDIGGEYLQGARALEQLQPQSSLDSVGVLGKLAHQALQYAEGLDLEDLYQLTLRLYMYHRQPLTPHWARRLRDESSVERFLQIGPGGKCRPLLDATWSRGKGERFGWLGWRRRLGRTRRHGGEVTYKLYVSPCPTALPEVFATLLRILPATAAYYFKVGSTTMGLLRPDKFVAYFDEFDDLAAAAELLASPLAGVRVHGVPFSAEITADGLLSWGVDPPDGEAVLQAEGSSSWRLWVSHQLACALLDARKQPARGMPPWRFALERLKCEGIDVERWTASPKLWRQATLTRI